MQRSKTVFCDIVVPLSNVELTNKQNKKRKVRKTYVFSKAYTHYYYYNRKWSDTEITQYLNSFEVFDNINKTGFII